MAEVAAILANEGGFKISTPFETNQNVFYALSQLRRNHDLYRSPTFHIIRMEDKIRLRARSQPTYGDGKLRAMYQYRHYFTSFTDRFFDNIQPLLRCFLKIQEGQT
jgi:hypothetical protein